MLKHQSKEIINRHAYLTRSKLSFSAATIKDVTDWTMIVNNMQLGDRAAALLGAMTELSQLDCTEILRFNLLQILHPSIEHILKALEHHFIYKKQSYTDRQNHLIELHTSLQLSFVHLYIDICYRSHNQLAQVKTKLFQISPKKSLKTTRLLASFYALQQLSLLLIQQQKRYVTPFIDQWRYTHALYRMAVQHRDHFINVNQLQGTHYPIANIHHAYIQILLIEIFNRFQIRPVEIEALYQCSFEWVKYVELTETPSASSRYMIDSSLDHPPQSIKNLEYNHSDVYMSTQALLEHINNIIQHNSKVMSKTEQHFLSTSLQFHVQNVLGSRHSERRHQRQSYHAEVEVAFDVDTTYFYLSQQYRPDQLQQDADAATTASTRPAFDDLDLSLSNHDFIEAAFAAELDREAIQRYRAQVLDMSPGGYRLHWEIESLHKLHTGQFIQLREQNHDYWKVGIIRWIKRSLMKTYAVGIEILSARVLPCLIEPIQQNQLSNDQIQPEHRLELPIQALVLQHQQDSAISFSLIFNDANRLQQDQDYQLTFMHLHIKVKVQATLLVTHSCIQYQCLLQATADELELIQLFNDLIDDNASPVTQATLATSSS